MVEDLLRRGGGFLSFPQGEIGAARYVSCVGTVGFKWCGFQKLYGPGATPAGSGGWEQSPTVRAVEARPAFLSRLRKFLQSNYSVFGIFPTPNFQLLDKLV